MQTKRRWIEWVWMMVVCVALVVWAPGCATKLAPGGAYNPDPAAQVALPELYRVDAAYLLAKSTLDAAFRWEQTHRETLWQASPQIKKALDQIRPAALKARQDYHAARARYVAAVEAGGVTPGLGTLNEVISRLEALAGVASSVLTAP